MTARIVLLCGLLVIATVAVGQAQDTVVVRRGSEPVRAARRAVWVFNGRATTRFFGPNTIGPNRFVRDDVGVLDGPLRVEGVIAGDLVALNADVELAGGAEVRGDVLVVGGRLIRSMDARVGGSVELHRGGVPIRRIGDRLEVIEQEHEPVRRWPPWRFRRYGWTGGASIVVSTGGTYNRIEGLPIVVGPRITWGGRDVNGRLQAVAIFRTAEGFGDDREDLGYEVNGRVRFGNDILTLGGRAYDVVTPIEDWQLDGDEVGLGAFVFHRDYRDYFLRRGIAGYVALEPVDGFTISGEVARNEDVSIPARDPWTLFRNDERWRTNPAIDEGDVTLLSAAIEYDSRQSYRYNGSGLHVRAAWERGIGDGVRQRVLPVAVRDPLPAGHVYDRAVIDLRWYERIGWSGQLRLRALGAGTIGDDPLPVQRRLSLGGPGAMPGFPFRAITCQNGVADLSSPALCDRMVLFQAEYRGDLTFGLSAFDHRAHRHDRRRETRLDWFDWDWGDWFWFEGPDLVLLADAGTAWLREDGPGDLDFDVGGGVVFGSLGVYAAKALSADGPLRFSLRLHHRF